MKAARLLVGLVCGAACLALFSGCETQQSACEREKRLTERMDEMQMELDNRIANVNVEVATMRANPPVVMQPSPVVAPAPVVQAMPVDTISIEYDAYGYDSSKRAQLEYLAQESREMQLRTPPPAPARASVSANTSRIRVPVPARTVQAALKEAGYYQGAIDGKVGRGTIAAITAFQRSQSLKADGIVGRQTWQHLYPYVPAGMSTTRLK